MTSYLPDPSTSPVSLTSPLYFLVVLQCRIPLKLTSQLINASSINNVCFHISFWIVQHGLFFFYGQSKKESFSCFLSQGQLRASFGEMLWKTGIQCASYPSNHPQARDACFLSHSLFLAPQCGRGQPGDGNSLAVTVATVLTRSVLHSGKKHTI